MAIVNGYFEAQEKSITVIEYCAAVDIPERTLYFWKREAALLESKKRGRKMAPANKLNQSERQKVVEVLLTEKWAALSPREIYYKLLDEEQSVIASVSTFYRIAHENSLMSRRGYKNNTGKKFNREKPVLVASRSNEIWSWDVTQLGSGFRTIRYYLYVIIDIWSRYVVGWTLEEHEKTDLAIQLWRRTLECQNLNGKGLVNHKDNGSIMTSEAMVKFVRDLEMVDSYSRAGVSDDNPYSESLFGTIKTFRTFPGSFNSLEEGREYFKSYFQEYNYRYLHTRIQFITPAQRHYGEEAKILEVRNKVLAEFYEKNKHRYSINHKIFEPILEVKIN